MPRERQDGEVDRLKVVESILTVVERGARTGVCATRREIAVKNSWRLGVVLGLVALGSALSCSDRMANSDNVGAVSQELSTAQTRILGFEGVAGSGGDWLGTSVKVQSGTQHVEGSKSAAFAVTATSAKITSVPLSSLGQISNKVTLSVLLPAYLRGLSYQGQVGLRLDSPTAGVFNQYYGPVVFTNSTPTGTWRQITFNLPAADVNALSTRTYSDWRRGPS